jgi:1-acyl-sn-glycerol-3-phosphate acyltransferase
MTRALRRLVRGAAVAWHLTLAIALVGLWLRPLAARDPDRGLRQRQRLTRWWMRRLLDILHVRLETTGTLVGEPALIVANHVSWLDIPCLLACSDARFVAKREVARWPVIGILAAGTGTVFLERGSGARFAAEQMAFVLARSERIIIFPEGTSTNGGAVRPFHARLYQAAVQAAAPVQAVAIRYPLAGALHPRGPFVGDDELVRHLWRLLAEPRIVARLHFCPPLSTAQMPRRALAEITRRQIVDALTSPATERPTAF